jgi:hypothetical protein
VVPAAAPPQWFHTVQADLLLAVLEEVAVAEILSLPN